MNPVLVETVRGNWVENIHHGSYAVCTASGELVLAKGDPAQPVLPRSSIKSMQALALFRSGAVEKFALDDEAIALACASHLGEAPHVEVVTRTLEKLGLGINDLECGTAQPSASAVRRKLLLAGEKATAVHNNCSGKHTGMLADALALGVPTAGYVERDHPVQKLVRACVEEVIGTNLTTQACGTDGCSIPTWAAPLESFASGFARMATGEGLKPDLAAAAKRIFAAATTHPFLVRGSDGLDTEGMEVFDGRVMLKNGADGVYCGAVIDKGIGFALKIDDGSLSAAQCAAANLLLAIAEPDEKQRAVLARYARVTNKNLRGIEVGQMRGSADGYSA